MAASRWDEGCGIGVLRQAEICLGSKLLFAGVLHLQLLAFILLTGDVIEESG